MTHIETMKLTHCEAGKDYCQQCRDEDVNTPLDAAVRYIQNNTPKLVSQEICEALNHIPDAKKMANALQEIGDFAHDKSTGPAVPDALWEIRSMAYNALVEQRLSNGCTHPQPKAEQDHIEQHLEMVEPKREPLTDEQKQLKFMKWGLIPANQSWGNHDWFYAGIAYAEAAHGIKE